MKKVDYNELSTELLKSRLAEMNAKSPFIEYNQSLENIIKSYLKYIENDPLKG
jgi:membrane-bound lytic murein transglycosylase D